MPRPIRPTYVALGSALLRGHGIGAAEICAMGGAVGMRAPGYFR